jgi:hypothetical protein
MGRVDKTSMSAIPCKKSPYPFRVAEKAAVLFPFETYRPEVS